MSTKNFVSYGDAETLFTGVGNKISDKQAKPTTISYADWLLLTPQQQETGNWLVTGVPGADLSLRVLALETNKQDKTDNNLQTTSKETTGAINELKSGLTNLITSVTGTKAEATYQPMGIAYASYTCPSGYAPIGVALTGGDYANQFLAGLSGDNIVRFVNTGTQALTTALNYKVYCIKDRI